MAGPSLTRVSLAGDVAAALRDVPPRPGVVQILGAGDRNLIIGRPANLRRWAAVRLGAGRPSPKSGRPPLDLRPVAEALVWTEATSAFHQRLTFERLMARYVAPAARRDLRPPAFLHLDPRERFPRLTVSPAKGAGEGLFGPFRDRRAASRAIDAVHKLFPLRPCDFVFEPAPDLPLGSACLFAQVRTCAAPCLVRIGEEEYRGLAGRAADFLTSPAARPTETRAWAPPWVAAAAARAVVVERARSGREVYPVRLGMVGEASVGIAEADLESALARLEWPEANAFGDDLAWLSSWLHAPRRPGAYVVLGPAPEATSAAEAVQEALAQEDRSREPPPVIS